MLAENNNISNEDRENIENLENELKKIEKEKENNSFYKELNKHNDDKPIIALCTSTLHASVGVIKKEENGDIKVIHIDQGGQKIDPTTPTTSMKNNGIEFEEYNVSQGQCVDSAEKISELIAKRGLENSKEYNSKNGNKTLNTGPDTRKKWEFKASHILIVPLIIDFISWLIGQGKPINSETINKISQIAEKTGQCHMINKAVDINELNKFAEIKNKEKDIKKKIDGIKKKYSLENTKNKSPLKSLSNIKSTNVKSNTIMSVKKKDEKSISK